MSISPTSPPTVWIDVYPNAQWSESGPINLLLVGSDGRSYHPNRCSFSGRADAIHIVSINPRSGGGTIVNIPRDSWVFVPGHGYDRINTALVFGGPRGIVEAVERLTGIPMHFVGVTTFCGIIAMVNAVGGLTMRIPRDIHDPDAGFGLKGECRAAHSLTKGVHRLNGCEVLFFSRSRHAMPGGDFDRTGNQAKVLVAGLRRFQELARTPRGMLEALQIIRAHVRMNLPCDSLVRLVRCSRFLALANLARMLIRPADLVSYTLRGVPCMRGSASVVCLSSSNDDAGDAIFRDVRSDALLNGH